jgi:hypothetical protein
VSLTADVTGVLPTANGGTNLGGATPFTSGGVVYASSSSALATGSALTWSGSQLNVSYADAAYNAGLRVTNTTNNIASQAKIYAVNDAGEYFSLGRNSTALGSQSALFATGNYPLEFYQDSTLRLTLTSSSLYTASGISVGIGTSSPSQKLEIAGTTASTEARVTTTTALAGFRVATTGGALALYLDNSAGSSFGAGAYSRNIYSDGAYPLLFWTNDQPRMRIDSAGNVGIGTTAIYYRLQTGNTSDTTIAMTNSSSVTSGNRGTIAMLNSSDSTVGFIRFGAVTDNVGTEIQFYTRPAAGSVTQSMTLNSVGGLQTLNTISVGNATPTTSGAGITFPATQSASSDANTLDDYEEGTWTPSFTVATGSATASAASGTYVKIGRQVSITINITFGVPVAATIDTITGLPFTSENANQRAVGALRENALTGNMWQLRVNGNATAANIRRYDNNDVILDTFNFNGTVTYFTA